jgi:hypothetical protein
VAGGDGIGGEEGEECKGFEEGKGKGIKGIRRRRMILFAKSPKPGASSQRPLADS